MNTDWLEVFDVTGSGYRPLIDFGAWGVAIFRFDEALRPDRIERLERHTATDEIFVLLEGRAVLLLGGNSDSHGGLHSLVMEMGKVYDVRRNAWHAALLGADASILLVENSDTGPQNTEFTPLGSEERAKVLELARRHSIP